LDYTNQPKKTTDNAEKAIIRLDTNAWLKERLVGGSLHTSQPSIAKFNLSK